MNTSHGVKFGPSAVGTPQRQRGVALAVALVFLVVLTVIGVTAMQTNLLEEKMAGNTQEMNRAFQTAESGIAEALQESNVTDATKTASTPNTYSYTYRSGEDTATAKAWYEAPGSKTPPGYSMGGPFAQHNFRIDSTGTTASGAKAEHHQGFYIVGPSQ